MELIPIAIGCAIAWWIGYNMDPTTHPKSVYIKASVMLVALLAAMYIIEGLAK